MRTYWDWYYFKRRLKLPNYDVKEIKAFIPSKNFSLSIEFYKDIGFELAWSEDELAYFKADNSSFLTRITI